MKSRAKITELTPTNGRKSFYGRAKVAETADGSKYLVSYETVVASVSPDGRVSRHSDRKSKTTCAYVKSFLSTFAPRTETDEFWKLPVSGRPELVVSI